MFAMRSKRLHPPFIATKISTNAVRSLTFLENVIQKNHLIVHKNHASTPQKSPFKYSFPTPDALFRLIYNRINPARIVFRPLSAQKESPISRTNKRCARILMKTFFLHYDEHEASEGRSYPRQTHLIVCMRNLEVRRKNSPCRSESLNAA